MSAESFRAWVPQMVDECRDTITRGLDHSANNAPGRVALAKSALERMTSAIARMLLANDQRLTTLEAVLAAAVVRVEAGHSATCATQALDDVIDRHACDCGHDALAAVCGKAKGE